MEEKEVWAEIANLQLDGVSIHLKMAEAAMINGLCGTAELHKHHAEDEFKGYVHVLCDYAEAFHEMPTPKHGTLPTVVLPGPAQEDNMVYLMDLYETWEKGVHTKLKNYKLKLTETKEHIDYLINDVAEEIKCVRLMQNDLDDGKHKELECWLKKKYAE